MRLALAQVNPTVGDVSGNGQLVRGAIARAADAGAHLVVFPELAIIGYPPKDLLLKPALIQACVDTVQQIAETCTDTAAIIGYPCPSDRSTGRMLYNAAALCQGGRIIHRHVKSLLPTYDVFDEHRYFEPGPPIDLAEFDAAGRTARLGITICEDLWNEDELFDRTLYHSHPVDQLAHRGVDLFINCSASPFVVRKHAFRVELMSHVARRYKLPLVYCNQVGGNDELVFDGNSCAFDAQGNVIAHAKAFEEDLLIFELNLHKPRPEAAAAEGPDQTTKTSPHASSLIADAYHALVLGLRDYCRKCGFESVVVGLSGGIDSAVTAALAAAALGPDRVRGVSMPSRYSSEGSKDDARLLAERLGFAFHTIPIADAHHAMEKLLTPHFAGRPPDATEENIQARLRGVILMALSNKFGSLLVTTGNKSELAVGYCTLYGDMCGGLAILSDVPKTMVYRLAQWINSPDCPLYQTCNGPAIPEASITKPPSAELRDNQTDQDTLPPYELLDDIIERYVEREQSAGQIIEQTGHDAETVLRIVRLIDVNEYKRKQMPPGLKITGRAFGFGRRMPIAQRYDNRLSLTAAKV